MQKTAHNPLDNLAGMRVILASGSPRRRELLAMLGIGFEVMALDGDESYPESLPAEEVSEYLARKKAGWRECAPGELMITADTTVVLDGAVLGKPADADSARAMLRALSGKTHKVITGVAIRTADSLQSFSAKTLVEFDRLSDNEIDWYVERFSPLDKAGAYGIQEWIGAAAVKSLTGSYYNVMGLPIHQLYRRLAAL